MSGHYAINVGSTRSERLPNVLATLDEHGNQFLPASGHRRAKLGYGRADELTECRCGTCKFAF